MKLPQIRLFRPGDVAYVDQSGELVGAPHLRVTNDGKLLVGLSGIAFGTASSSFVLAESKAASWVMADFELTNTGNGTDSGAIRALYLTANSGASSSGRAGEFHAFRQAGASAGNTWALELGVHSDVAGNGVSQLTGIYALSSHSGWPQTPTGHRADYFMVVGGQDGWTGLVRYYDTDGTTVLFDIDQSGNVKSIGNLISATQTNTFSVASNHPITAAEVQGYSLAMVQASATCTVTMPPPATTNMGQIAIVYTGTGTVTIARNSSEVFVLADGTTPTSLTLSATFKKYVMVSNGTNWIVLYHD